VKAANRLSTVIAELTGQTFRRVGDENRFLYPFHPDTNPSFDANDEKDGGVYCCRSCGAKGDVIAFVQQHERLDLQTSLAFLAQRGSVASTVLSRRDDAPRPQSPPSKVRAEDIEREHHYSRGGVLIARKVLLKKRDLDGKKIMLWEHPDAAGGWLKGMGGADPGLFGFDDAVARKTTYGEPNHHGRRERRDGTARTRVVGRKQSSRREGPVVAREYRRHYRRGIFESVRHWGPRRSRRRLQPDGAADRGGLPPICDHQRGRPA